MQTCPAKKIKSQCVKETSKFLHLDHRKLEQMIPRKRSRRNLVISPIGRVERGGVVVGAPAHVRSCLCVCAAATYCRGCLRAALSNWPQPTRASRGAGDEVRACVLACACLRERGCVGAWEHPNLCVRACATGGSLSRVCVASACAGDCLPQLQ